VAIVPVDAPRLQHAQHEVVLARPADVVHDLVVAAEDGRVVYALRRHWKDGTLAFVFDPLDFIAGSRPWCLARGPIS
jgi:hypothetical protein